MRRRAANRVSLRLGGVGDGWERGEVDGDLIVLEIGCMWRSRHWSAVCAKNGETLKIKLPFKF